MELSDFFHAYPKCALAFSGGVDSAYLLYAGLQSGADMGVYYVKTAFQPAFELADAGRLTKMLGVKLHILDEDILSVAHVAENPWNRCYFCKKAIFSAIARAAASDGYSILLDGTNASDEEADRPGVRALRELEIRSPLREAGLSKSEIRRLSREAGLFTWEKPAYACLATRIPTGEPITQEKLEATERAEVCLARLGFRNFRVRRAGNMARLQVTADQQQMALDYREVITRELKKYYSGVLLDLEVRNEQ